MPFGTLEEQAFYLVVTPSVAVLGLAVLRLRDVGRGPRPLRRPVLVAAGLAVAVLAVTVVDAAACWREHSVADNGYEQYVAWVERTLKPTDRLAVTDTTAQFITPG